MRAVEKDKASAIKQAANKNRGCCRNDSKIRAGSKNIPLKLASAEAGLSAEATGPAELLPA
jgi:hypothetical protein